MVEGDARFDMVAEGSGRAIVFEHKVWSALGTDTLTRYNPARVGRDAGEIAAEVIAHLAGLVGSEVTVTLEIEANIPEGAPEHVVRTVTENNRTLKFTSQGFEEE